MTTARDFLESIGTSMARLQNLAEPDLADAIDKLAAIDAQLATVAWQLTEPNTCETCGSIVEPAHVGPTCPGCECF